MEKPANRLLLIVLGIIDAPVISLIIAFLAGSKGLFSQFYIFYFPIVLAFAFVFLRAAQHVYSLLHSALHRHLHLFLTGVSCGDGGSRAAGHSSDHDGAMGMIGAYYYRIQRSRRSANLPRISPAADLAEA